MREESDCGLCDELNTSLASLPVEILEEIFALACSDGGFTGCSLSRTSKSIQAASRSMRFTSVCIGPRDLDDAQLSQFFTSFTQERVRAATAGTLVPRVHNFFLAAPFTSESESLRRPGARGGSTEVGLGRCVSTAQTSTFHEDATALMRLVAPDLCTLALVNGRFNDVGLPSALAHAPYFPRLRELTVVDRDGKLEFAPVLSRRTTQATSPVAAHGEEAPPRFPLLERLNIPGCLEMLDLRRWAHTALKLTHIRITHLRDILGQMANDDLARFLGAEHEQERGVDFAHLETLMVQPRPRPAPGARASNVYVTYSDFCNQLKKLHYVSTQSWALIPAMEPSWSIYEDRDMALQDWRDRLEGGEGCWKMDEEWLVRVRP